MKQPDYFFSCDWGTTSFRLRLVRMGQEVQMVDEVREAAMGFGLIAGTEDDPLKLLNEKLSALCQRHDLDGTVPVIVSGMASSSIGILELPYARLPLGSAAELITEEMRCGPHPLHLVSGLRSENDVMRGEEVQILACMHLQIETNAQSHIILPGTHCKHARIKEGRLIDFYTYMSGELFGLLGSHSSLRHSLEGGHHTFDDQAFAEGVGDSEGHLLNRLFVVRTRQLLHKQTAASNASYLSGLLIGYELRNLQADTVRAITLCADNPFMLRYQKALHLLGFIPPQLISEAEATLLGHQLVHRQIYQT